MRCLAFDSYVWRGGPGSVISLQLSCKCLTHPDEVLLRPACLWRGMSDSVYSTYAQLGAASSEFPADAMVQCRNPCCCSKARAVGRLLSMLHVVIAAALAAQILRTKLHN